MGVSIAPTGTPDFAAILGGTAPPRSPATTMAPSVIADPRAVRSPTDIAQATFTALHADQPYQAVAQQMDTGRLEQGLQVWEAIRAQAEAENEEAKLAMDILSPYVEDATPEERGAFIAEVQTRDETDGDDTPESMQRIAAEVAQEMGLTGGRKAETREFKVGNQIITQQRDPATGQWQTMAGAPRFAPSFYRDSVAPITDKILNGESLSEGEQEIWSTYNNFGMLELLMKDAMSTATTTIPTVATEADFNALPSGARYIGTDGNQYTKP